MGRVLDVRAAFEAIPVPMVATWGPDHVILAANAAHRAVAGRDRYIGQPAFTVFADLAGQQIFELFDRVYRTGEAEHWPEWRVQLQRDGVGAVEFFADIWVFAYRGDDGAVQGLHFVLQDRTEQVRARIAAQSDVDAARRELLQAREVITGLQDALLPEQLPVLPGVELASRYLVAARHQAAGGDWFDAVPLRDGTLALIVGDVVGHGVAASAAMGQLRAVLNRALLELCDLELALGWVDRMAASSSVMRAATICLAVLDPTSGSVRYSTCGHPPPLMITDGQATVLPSSGSGPLGTGAPIVVAATVLSPGGVLMLYSDGLIEQPGVPLQERLATLQQVAADAAANRVLPLGASRSVVERIGQQCVEVMTRTGYDDDVTVLTAQRRPEPVPSWVDERPATLAGIGPVRTGLRAWLELIGATGADQDDLDLAVHELIANVVEHAYPSTADQDTDTDTAASMRIRADLGADGVVTVQVTDDGRWVPNTTPQPVSGRGLWMAGAVVDTLVITHLGRDEGSDSPVGASGHPTASPSGTMVTVRKHLTRPALLASPSASPPAPRAGVSFAVRSEPGPPRVLRVAGPVDISTAAEFADRLDIATRGGVHPLEIDLSQVTVLASAGIRVLFDLRDQLAVHGHPLTVTAAGDSLVRHVLDLVGLPGNARDA